MRAFALCALFACAAPPSSPARPHEVEALPPGELPSYLASSRIAALADGALVIDADSGMLVRTDRAGAAVARLHIGAGPGTLALDTGGGVAYVADRAGDRIVVVDVGSGLVQRTVWTTAAEPVGVALTPGGATALVTFGADRALVAYDTRTGRERWRAAMPAEPRSIAVSPDGSRALVTTVTTGSLLDVALATRAVSEIAFDSLCDRCVEGEPFTRGAAVMFLDTRRAVASFQREVPRAIEMFSSAVGRYGGTAKTPITQHLAFLSFDGAAPPKQVVAQIFANQPRSLSWDARRDILFIAGVAMDSFVALPGLTSSTTAELGTEAKRFRLSPSETCGPDGMARTDDTVYVWCSLSRRVVAVTADGSREGAPVAPSSLPDAAHDGLVLFHAARREINRGRAITCSTCHPEGRADGLSWQIQSEVLQTPVLAGRVARTPPYKWTGSDATLDHSVGSTVGRLGGTGLSSAQNAALVAYLESLPAPRRPTLDRAAVARGKALFDAWDCGTCHSGPRYTDGQMHAFRDGQRSYDTPSLLGLAASGPYYHDGSAPTIAGLLEGQGKIRGMSDLSRFTAAQRRDLAAFLASL